MEGQIFTLRSAFDGGGFSLGQLLYKVDPSAVSLKTKRVHPRLPAATRAYPRFEISVRLEAAEGG